MQRTQQKIIISQIDFLVRVGRFIRIGNSNYATARVFLLILIHGFSGLFEPHSLGLFSYYSLQAFLLICIMLDLVLITGEFSIFIGDRSWSNRSASSKQNNKHQEYTNSDNAILAAKKQWAMKTLEIQEPIDHSKLRKAYAAMSKRYHPDHNRNNPNAEKNFRIIHDAYQILKD